MLSHTLTKIIQVYHRCSYEIYACYKILEVLRSPAESTAGPLH
jgi:hypothetical protein